MDNNYTISDDLIELFRIKYDFKLDAYIDDYFYFVQFQYPNIISFYIGNLEKSESEFIALTALVNTSNTLDNLLRESKGNFTTYEHWQFIDYITDMREKLLVINKIYKFVRSSKTRTNFASELKYEYNLGQGENLEKASRFQIGSDNFQNDWQNIAIENDLQEIDYTSKSGNRIIMSVKLNTESLGITSICDSVEGIKVLGLDLNKRVTFADDDLQVLTYLDTFLQSVEILVGLLKDHIPEFPNMGRGRTMGTSLNVFNMNSVIRELTETISSDDSIINFSILDISNDYDNNQITMKCEFKSRLDYIKTNKILSA